MAVIRGTPADDRLQGTEAADSIFGNAGDDHVVAKAGDDTVYGGRGEDRLSGDDGADRLFGEGGFDNLTGGQGNDRLFGGASNDVFSDIDGYSGRDVFDGGDGIDQFYASNDPAAGGVVITLAENGAYGQSRQGGVVDILRNIENVDATPYDDRVIGNSAANTIGFSRGGGSDAVYGRGGNDTLFGNNDDDGTGDVSLLAGDAGNDRIYSGYGVFRILGGSGADRIQLQYDFTGDNLQDPPGDVTTRDSVDLGADQARDTVAADIGYVFDDVDALPLGMGVDRVSRFGAEDGLFVRMDLVDVSGTLDSDRNGRIDNADADVRSVSGDLVLDFDSLFQRETGNALGIGDQHIVLADVASIDADQLLSAYPGPSDFIV